MTKRKTEEQKKNYAEEKINKIEHNNKSFIEKADKLFSFALNAKKDFKKGTPEQRREIILNLGSRQEIKRVKPFDIGLDKRKTAPIRAVFPVMSG